MALGPYRTIHPRWSEHHRPTATGTQTGECAITRADGAGATGADGTWTPPERTTIYTGTCRILVTQIIGGEQHQQPAGAQQTTRRYNVTIDHAATLPAIGDAIEITKAADVAFVGKSLRVVDVQHGTEQWQRVLIAVDTEAIE